MDPQLVMHRPKSFESHLGTVRAQDRFATILMGAFAILALVLSVVGTYGVLSGSVAGRTREFGSRMALGSDARKVRSIVLRYAATLTFPGVAIGILAALGSSRWIESMLFGVHSTDLVAYSGATLIFLAVGTIAALIPARHATRVDTTKALTTE
jgi:putative ABC transport system permease protein